MTIITLSRSSLQAGKSCLRCGEPMSPGEEVVTIGQDGMHEECRGSER